MLVQFHTALPPVNPAILPPCPHTPATSEKKDNPPAKIQKPSVGKHPKPSRHLPLKQITETYNSFSVLPVDMDTVEMDDGSDIIEPSHLIRPPES